MRARRIVSGLALVFIFSWAGGQVISSQKSYLKLNKEKAPVRLVVPVDNGAEDRTPPEIMLVSHNVDEDGVISSSDSEAILIGKITDQSGISSLLINSKVTEVSDAGIFTIKIDLLPGSNDVAIVALDKQDNFSNFRFSIDYKPVTQTLAETASSESVYYALIIGINNYADPAINSLDNPISDAEAIYNVLTSKYTFKKENIQFLKDAKRDDIIYSLDYLSRAVTSNDNLLIFYAGHGQFDENSNIGYWLPSDARKITKADWFRNSTLVDYLKEIETKHTLLITDACFGGSIFKTRAAFADTPKDIEVLYNLPSRKAMTSGNVSEVPDDSPFAKFLIERLESNPENYLSSEQLFSNLRVAVINNSDAVPMYGEIRNVGDQGGDFIFIKK